MQFQVPQFIETEDKIVGPLTLKQFMYIGAAGGISFLLYFTVGGIVAVILAFILLAIGGALAFIKIEGRPLLNVLTAAANFYWKPQTYVWQPEHPTLGKLPNKPAESSVVPSSIEEIIRKIVAKTSSHENARPKQPLAPAPIEQAIQKVAAGSALHETWQNMQTGAKLSDKQFVQKKMEARYQIFRREAGDRNAARRIDYR